ncbi:hypothetical protein MH215_19230 [Paenibacillus sp. ACRSA]|uniref:hypothetical protein n=1 Tax=Paenibacillus sp. ACRSA TaxID=2918211 RepID=UPI001EF69854|nr:hypothetical protein [Paenibacillus sp. ACRSA]MCG7379152.1 hypothetical protein [Paenibacillus sp. ACRSA]
MIIMVEPSAERIGCWIEGYVPSKDLFFLKKEHLIKLEMYLNDVLILPSKEFFRHSSYNQIQLVNSFEYWKIDKEIQYVLVADPNWLCSLSSEMQKWINHIQLTVHRGLILPISLLSTPYIFPEEHLVKDHEEEYVVLHSKLWSELPYKVKVDLLKEYAKKWDDWNGYALDDSVPSHLQRYANTFPAEGGGNCLAATLFAVSQQEWILNEWVHPETFAEGLKRAHYVMRDTEELRTGDVVVWMDANDIVQHASYHMGQNLFFNKDGQTFFNPWKVIDWKTLKLEWASYTYKVYRKEILT